MTAPDFSILKGLTLTEINDAPVRLPDGRRWGDDVLLRMTTSCGRIFELYHDQCCCESVTLEDVVGNLYDLIGRPLLMAEIVDSGDAPPASVSTYGPDSYTWTYYKLATIKGYVTLRFYGESNGYYSEEVDFREVDARGIEIRPKPAPRGFTVVARPADFPFVPTLWTKTFL